MKLKNISLIIYILIIAPKLTALDNIPQTKYQYSAEELIKLKPSNNQSLLIKLNPDLPFINYIKFASNHTLYVESSKTIIIYDLISNKFNNIQNITTIPFRIFQLDQNCCVQFIPAPNTSEKSYLQKIKDGLVTKVETKNVLEEDIIVSKISPDKKSLFLGLESGEMLVIDVENGNYKSIQAHEGYISDIIFLQSKNRFLSISYEQDNLVIGHIDTLQITNCIEGSENDYLTWDAIAISPCEDFFALLCHTGQIFIWNIKEGKLEHELKTSSKNKKLDPSEIIWSSDGRYLIINLRYKIEFWDIKRRKHLKSIYLSKPCIEAALSPDQEKLAVASGQEIRIYGLKEDKLQYERSIGLKV